MPGRYATMFRHPLFENSPLAEQQQQQQQPPGFVQTTGRNPFRRPSPPSPAVDNSPARQSAP
ncbi:hypothetical protein M406DRAFT_322700 [Cryphonectria parasitica EP155]|uniref:Uncharacterized protein n=1 Tax=Cryphonectria parasitica (strain ATCC 38755 / EP155) TaxID=660469 RepID=A0A9P4Y130_CRYP1|nr:uncharacterized protein M406DRAFT_322700 [Cryphonectria parasitica EP155]KAF3764728.1 hypothetical protein M406DRAFT_322700 [Cryphonectria parasitica EP155]